MHSSVSIYDVIDDQSRATAAGGGGLAGGQPTTAAVATPDYLESGGNYCEQREKKEGEQYEVIGVGCRSRFCKQCCVGLGLTLRERLVPILETFSGLLMWTFTIDPKLFASPADAFNYVRDNRCISNTMRELRKRGLMHTNRYFVVVEWQMGSGDEPGTLMPHWHLLSDSSYIPFDTVCQLWNRFRPIWAGPVEGDRPGFGSVRFTAPKFDTPKHAACYACKYLIKYPEKGYPEWVMENKAHIHRFSTSRGFWGETPKLEEVPALDEEALLTSDSSETDPDNAQQGEDTPRTTIRERLAKCGEKTVVMKVVECVDSGTGEITTRKQFVMRLEASLNGVAELLHRTFKVGVKRLEGVPRSALEMLVKFRMTRAR